MHWGDVTFYKIFPYLWDFLIEYTD